LSNISLVARSQCLLAGFYNSHELSISTLFSSNSRLLGLFDDGSEGEGAGAGGGGEAVGVQRAGAPAVDAAHAAVLAVKGEDGV